MRSLLPWLGVVRCNNIGSNFYHKRWCLFSRFSFLCTTAFVIQLSCSFEILYPQQQPNSPLYHHHYPPSYPPHTRRRAFVKTKVSLRTTTERSRLLMTSSSSKELEVEEKFVIGNNAKQLQSRLMELGFVSKGEDTVFVDWYYDNQDCTLSTQDCWIRYRELIADEKEEGNNSRKGQWQTKLRRHPPSGSSETENGAAPSQSMATVYEETGGEEAVRVALSVLSSSSPEKFRIDQSRGQKFSKTNNIDGYPIPLLPIEENNDNNSDYGLEPFCRLETTRSSWILPPNDCNSNKHKYYGLHVDLDITNTGHNVGEVETVVSQDHEIDIAKRRIQKLVLELTKSKDDENDKDEETSTKQAVAIGKLEHYLIHNRPEHYAKCVEAGTIKAR